MHNKNYESWNAKTTYKLGRREYNQTRDERNISKESPRFLTNPYFLAKWEKKDTSSITHNILEFGKKITLFRVKLRTSELLII
jgi:hypothetical protein